MLEHGVTQYIQDANVYWAIRKEVLWQLQLPAERTEMRNWECIMICLSWLGMNGVALVVFGAEMAIAKWMD